MPMNSRTLSLLYKRAHDRMRDVEGLLPQEAFDELLKFLFYKDCVEIQMKAACIRNNSQLREDPIAIREWFSKELIARVPWITQVWPDRCFHLSDSTLLDLQRLFAHVQLTELSLDVRSTALSTFLTSDVRKGLGIFPTPEDVVRSMIEVVAPEPNDIVLDPACGTGTFLLETVRFLSTQRSKRKPLTVYGVEKNPRMLLLADLNLGYKSDLIFHRICADSLRQIGRSEVSALGLVPNSVDIILTNPPFGVTVTSDMKILDLFETGEMNLGQEQSKVPSEVLFVELCLRLLRPGGRLGIVLPRSVITNERIDRQRHMIDQLGHLTEIIDLPPETFISAGTQTTTVAAFFRKHSVKRAQKTVSVRVCRVTNVGFDTTGRRKEGNQLPVLAAKLAEADPVGDPIMTTYSEIPPTETLQRAANLLFRRNGDRVGRALREFVEFANTGRTPGRSAYTDNGMFILKVGNLTGRGIDWEPRDRNFVSRAEGIKRAKSYKLNLHKGDILLTSSAHAARYIAKKVDVVAYIPENYENVTFVGEVIRLRPASDVDPFILLAALRHPRVRDDLQACVRGQTAHLNPNDLLAVTIPYDLREPDQNMTEAASLLKQEADLAFQLNLIAAQASRLLKLTNTAPV